MAFRDLIPWSRDRDVSVRRGEEFNPLMTLHREMNRMFDDVFRGAFDSPGWRHNGWIGWPHVEVSETDSELKVCAEIPGLDEKDVEVELTNGILVIKGEKKTESEEKDRRFSERFYGRFERRIAVDEVEADKVNASFENGVLTVTLPKTAGARNVQRIAINTGNGTKGSRRNNRIERKESGGV
jgi:HSP20 family protein